MLGLTSDENVPVVIKEGYPLAWSAPGKESARRGT